MQKLPKPLLLLTAVAASAATMGSLWAGYWIVATLTLLTSVTAIAAFVVLIRRKDRKQETSDTHPSKQRPTAEPMVRRTPSEPGDLTEEMISANRYALLLRPQIAQNLSPSQVELARNALEEDMAIVPEGDVFLSQPDDREESERPLSTSGGRVLRVEAALMDRYPVTNYQFKQFIDAGGYEEMALWDAEIWPGVFGFVDATGIPGPRFWKNGEYEDSADDHPVVGVCWYEANAYSRWVGKRLPSDAEWVKSACWPMPVQRGVPTQRRFPWGNAWEPDRANVWSVGLETTCSVTDFTDGASVAGVYGLVGNVWEWTADPFGLWHGSAGYQDVENFRSLRGGAFDTYFEGQANCQFQSGDSPLARKRNIGFRCGLGLCDLQPVGAENPTSNQNELACEVV